jgi:Fur family transcriptional regulator, ferric uptake regulator
MLATDATEHAKRVFLDFLEKRGHRKTSERFAILQAVYDHGGHFDIELLHGQLKQRNYRVSRATLYNTMDLLVECDLVRKHQFGQNQAQFERAFSNRQHDHLICERCGKVTEFCDPRIQHIRNTVSEVMDFQVHHHSLHIHGTCAQCRAEQQNP